MIKRGFPGLFLAFLLVGPTAMSQHWGPFGITYKVGFSTNATLKPNAIYDPILNSVVPSTSVSFFTTYRFKLDSAWHLFSYLKLGLGGSFRGGVFDVNGTPTRISMTFVDLDLLLPLRIPLSQNLEMQWAMGANLGFKVRQNTNTPDTGVFQPGIIFEMGMGTRHGSFLGFSLAQSLVSYSVLNVSFMTSLSMGDMRAGIRKK